MKAVSAGEADFWGPALRDGPGKQVNALATLHLVGSRLGLKMARGDLPCRQLWHLLWTSLILADEEKRLLCSHCLLDRGRVWTSLLLRMDCPFIRNGGIYQGMTKPRALSGRGRMPLVALQEHVLSLLHHLALIFFSSGSNSAGAALTLSRVRTPVMKNR